MAVRLDNMFGEKFFRRFGGVLIIVVVVVYLFSFLRDRSDESKSGNEEVAEAPSASAPVTPVAEPTKQEVSKAEVKQLKARIDELEKEATKSKEELDNLKRTLNQMSDDLRPFFDLIKTQNRIRILKKEIGEKSNELTELQKKLLNWQKWFRWHFVGNS